MELEDGTTINALRCGPRKQYFVLQLTTGSLDTHKPGYSSSYPLVRLSVSSQYSGAKPTLGSRPFKCLKRGGDPTRTQIFQKEKNDSAQTRLPMSSSTRFHGREMIEILKKPHKSLEASGRCIGISTFQVLGSQYLHSRGFLGL